VNRIVSFLAACVLTWAPVCLADDWPHFLGPKYNATSAETKLLKTWPEKGPKIVWEFPKGVGYACPAIVGDRLVLFHRIDDSEVVDCLDAATGKPLWKFDYPAPYRARYGDRPSTRSSPVIADGHVFTYGVAGMLHCLDLTTGKVVWKRDFAREPGLAPAFFGIGTTPLVLGKRLILNIGANDGTSVIALDTATGRELWKAKHEWGASYASPVPATLHGRECVLVFAGGQSRPPTGGLLTLDAATGEILNATPHRAPIAESVSASSPVLADAKRGLVFVSEAYGSGGAMIEIAPDFSAKVAWPTEKLGAYWMTPIVKDGCLYGFDGLNQRHAELVCLEISTGKELWRNDLGGKFQRGSLLAVDDAVLCLGENGDLAWLDLSPKGAVLKQHAKLFDAPETWAGPALSRGLLYVMQNEPGSSGTKPRLICYDLSTER
jgi:outer membrane protein assembly factor BamB